MPPPPTTQSVSRRGRHDFGIFWVGQVLSAIGSQLTMLAIPLLVLAKTQSVAESGLVAACRGVSFGLLMLPAGVMVDRADRLTVLLIADVGRFLAIGSVAGALASGSLSITHLCIASAAEGAFSALFSTASIASLTRLVARERLAISVAALQSIGAVAMAVGPPVGGFLFSFSIVLPFMSDTLSYAASIVSVLLIRASLRGEGNGDRKRHGGIAGEVRNGFSWLWAHPTLRVLVSLNAGMFTVGLGYPLVVIVLAKRAAASPTGIGIAFGGSGVGLVIGGLAASTIMRRFTLRQIVLGSVWTWTLVWPTWLLPHSPILLALPVACSFASMAVYIAATASYRLAQVPNALQGRINSIFLLITFGAQPISFALTGMALKELGPTATMLFAFALLVGLSIVATLHPALRQKALAVSGR